MMTTRIGAILLRAGFVTSEQVEKARDVRLDRIRVKSRQESRLGEILVELGFVTPKQLTWALIEQQRVRVGLKRHEREMEKAHLALEEMRTAALSI